MACMYKIWFINAFVQILTRPSYDEKQLVTSLQEQENELSQINAQVSAEYMCMCVYPQKY
jgi:hypothetical protein